MGAILKNNSIFLHVPKTAGNWVVEILKAHNLYEKDFKHKHSDASRLQIIHEKVFKQSPFIFCFVRHPVTWFESWYRYQRKRKFKKWAHNGNMFYHPCSNIDDCQDEDFNKFASNVIDKSPGFISNMYYQFTRHSEFVGKQENLIKDTLKIFNFMKININYNYILSQQKINVSKKYSIEWDKKVKEELQKIEISGMKRYGYNTIV